VRGPPFKALRGERFAIVGAVVWTVVLVLASTESGRRIENDLTLAALYAWRGAVDPPGDVVVIKLDESAADAFDQRVSVGNWPRVLHACLVTRLSEMGAAVIVFDVVFAEADKEASTLQRLSVGGRVVCDGQASGGDTAMLAGSLRAAGNVLVASELWRSASVKGRLVERPPTMSIEAAALAVGPFPLPDTGSVVSQFWAFYPTSDGQVGGMLPIPTLPALALHAFVSPGRGAVSGDEVDARHQELIPERRPLRERMIERRQYTLMADVPSPTKRAAEAELDVLYQGQAWRYLNLYGPPGALPSVRYEDVFDASKFSQIRNAIRGKVVFIGAAEHITSDRMDSYFTSFPADPGQKYGGVEIMATAFANLRWHHDLRLLNVVETALLLLVVAVMACMAIWRWEPIVVFPSCAVLIGGFVVVALSLFSRWSICVPVIWPTFAASLCLVGGTVLKQLHFRALSKKLFSVAQKFVSPHAWQFDRGGEGAGHRANMVFGTVLVTDAANFTRVIEGLGDDLRAGVELLTAYYSAISTPIDKADPPGLIIDTAGDGLLTIWDAPEDSPDVRLAACRAAIQVQQAVDIFNQNHSATALPTRIGVHAGDLAIGAIDARERRFIKAVGDVTNTASRIESLNKYLGTSLLASCAAVAGLEEALLVRPCGAYLLPGKLEAVSVFEIVCETSSATHEEIERFALYGSAFDLYSKQCWPEAQAAFERYLETYPHDGVARKLLEKCKTARVRGSESADARVLVIGAK
jgi:adenylate cyclase